MVDIGRRSIAYQIAWESGVNTFSLTWSGLQAQKLNHLYWLPFGSKEEVPKEEEEESKINEDVVNCAIEEIK